MSGRRNNYSDVSRKDLNRRGHRYNTRLASRRHSVEREENSHFPICSYEVDLEDDIENRVRDSGADFGNLADDAMDYRCERHNTRSNKSKFLLGILLFLGFAALVFTLYDFYSQIQFLKKELLNYPSENPSKDRFRRQKDKEANRNKDPVGRPDFALESTGGRIVDVKGRNYANAPKTFLGLTLCDGPNGPSAMIQTNTDPGHCWAFEGNYAVATIELMEYILIDSVTLEHIPSEISPSGTIDTAPKDFKIWGLNAPKDQNKKLLGQFAYVEDGGSIQKFPLKNNTDYHKFVQVEFLSNHGNPVYTCVYRFRVHGVVFRPK